MLRASFKPEFLNRLDEIIMFKPLTKDNIGGIIELLMKEINLRLVEKEISIELTGTARQFIIDNGYDEVYGARPLKRFIQANVETLLAKRIIRDNPKAGTVYTVDSDGQQLIIK